MQRSLVPNKTWNTRRASWVCILSTCWVVDYYWYVLWTDSLQLLFTVALNQVNYSFVSSDQYFETCENKNVSMWCQRLIRLHRDAALYWRRRRRRRRRRLACPGVWRCSQSRCDGHLATPASPTAGVPHRASPLTRTRSLIHTDTFIQRLWMCWRSDFGSNERNANGASFSHFTPLPNSRAATATLKKRRLFGGMVTALNFPSSDTYCRCYSFKSQKTCMKATNN